MSRIPHTGKPQMKSLISERIWNVLACPYCAGPLSQSDGGAECPTCHEQFHYTRNGQLDCRLRKPKSYQLDLCLGAGLLPEEGFHFCVLQPHPSPQVDFGTGVVPKRLDRTLMSYFPKAKGADSLVLDLGCGNTIHKEVCEHAGFGYIGLDIDSAEAPVLGDAHALPFRDNSFEFVLSVAVLEHIRYPFVMMNEVYRTLQPGGVLVGSVAFLEPTHDNSFYHHSHLGAFNSLGSAGFRIERLAPSAAWSVLAAQANMMLFPRMPSWLSKSLVMPLHWLHRLWWRLAHILARKPGASEYYRVLYTTGAFSFVARKPEHA